MKNNLATFLNLQTLYWTAVEAWCKAGFDVWRKANEEYWKVLHPAPHHVAHRLGEDRHEKQPCQATAAHLDHKYGRRCHDVDVEHI